MDSTPRTAYVASTRSRLALNEGRSGSLTFHVALPRYHGKERERQEDKAAEGGLNRGRHSRKRDWSRGKRECPDAPARSPLKPVLGPEISPSGGKPIISQRGRGLQWPVRQWCFYPWLSMVPGGSVNLVGGDPVRPLVEGVRTIPVWESVFCSPSRARAMTCPPELN